MRKTVPYPCAWLMAFVYVFAWLMNCCFEDNLWRHQERWNEPGQQFLCWYVWQGTLGEWTCTCTLQTCKAVFQVFDAHLWLVDATRYTPKYQCIYWVCWLLMSIFGKYIRLSEYLRYLASCRSSAYHVWFYFVIFFAELSFEVTAKLYSSSFIVCNLSPVSLLWHGPACFHEFFHCFSVIENPVMSAETNFSKSSSWY